ncbi:protein ELYS isoform X1 [Nasonia vitripennis]|uniref:ELYS-like domain-containing protein n=2 Tax=Nasonia vitripennis TaxID=7425 RepID=A0A7M7R2Z4_NASVI|nr:protein ELYS isoform X1 [Nasonia vitripennis]
MKELEETNCEVRNVLNFTLPLWNQSVNNWGSQEEPMTTDGSNESNQDQTLGGFLNSDCKYAWLSCGTRLVVIDVRCGKCISHWNFSYKITSVSPFPTESAGKIPLLLVGLDNDAIRIKDSIGHLCIFNCCNTTILATIQVPAGVEKACVIHGGAEWEEFNEKRPDTVLAGNTGLIFAALRNLQHIVIDANRLLWANSVWDGKDVISKLEFVNPLNSSTTTSKNKKEPTHLAYDLMDKEIEQYMGFDRNDFESTPLYDESLCSVLLSSTKIGCLITGCLGRVIIWQNDGSIGWISPPFDADNNAYVTHVALLEPSDDPRPFYYLWVACQNDSQESSAVLRMYAMLFNKKRNCEKAGESSLYFSLESEPSLKFELELEQGERVHSLLAVERENSRDSADCSLRGHGEDSLLLIGTSERLLMFDLNRWYKEQMPRTMAECRNPNSVMASYRTKQEDDDRKEIIACSFIPKSLREFPKGPTSPEELFYPNSLTLEWVELGLDNLTFWLARGVQTELLREIMIAGPIVLVKPTETYRRCLAAGLMPFDSLPQDHALDAEKCHQREMLLCLCLEQRWTKFLSRCANEWSDGSAAYLYPEFIRWGVQRASELKLCADSLCVPLFDQSGANIGEAEVKTLRFCCQQLECLTNVVSKLPNLESDLEKQRRTLKRIATYLEVLLWFYDVGLLPENQVIEEEEEEDMPQITLLSKIPYPRDKLVELYKKKRVASNGEEKEEEKLFIDQLIYHDCLRLRAQWEKEAGYEVPDHGGFYPPPSLQSLLRSFLVDCHRDDPDVTAATASAVDDQQADELDQAEMESKHSIAIYLLMDIAMLLQGTNPAVDRLIKYPSAFKLSPSLIKMTQAFWLLDHDDYDGFFKIITGQLIHSSDIKDWHHKLAIMALLKADQHKLALAYMRILKPPLASLDDQGTMITLSVGQGLVESAFHARPPSHYAQLLTKFFEACKANGKLGDILQLSLDTEEEEAFIKFLKKNDCDDTRLLYYLQRCRHTEASDLFTLDRMLNTRSNSTASKIQPNTLKVLSAFNATLPDITRHFATNYAKSTIPNSLASNKPIQPLQHQLSFMDPSSVMTNAGTGRCYPRPMSQCRDKLRGIYEIAVSKTRETCLKADRPGSSLTHVPFIDAPCSTIVFCSRASGNLPEPTDAYNVLYPEKKVINGGKRTHNMMAEGDDNADSNIEKKRRRLENGTAEIDMSSGDNQARLTRRLSMSNVCETPLVQRKLRPDVQTDSNGLNIETPHSILKIRELFRRNSDSPGYGFKNNLASEKEEYITHCASENVRPARQIRFSMDRMSGNGDTSSVNESKVEDPETESNYSTSSKNIEEESCAEEAFYSPNVSNKSLRNSSILSDGSVTKFIHGPRARRSLRRSSMLSGQSSDYQSNKTTSSANTTLDVSELDTSSEKSKKASNFSSLSPRKSILNSPSLYNASILSGDTSIEVSPFKRPFTLNNERNNDDETDESDNQSEDSQEVVAELNDTGLDKDSSVEPSIKEPEEKDEDEGIIEEEIDEEEKEAQNEEPNDDQMESQNEDVEEEGGGGANIDKSASSAYNLSQQNEISEDEDEQKFEQQPQKALEKEEEDEEEVDEDDTFQSLNNSANNAVASEITANCIRELENNIDLESRFSFISSVQQRTTIRRYEYNQDYSLTKNITLEKRDSSSFNYSLTKPIFLDSCGIARLQDSIVITDDESNDAVEVEQAGLEPVDIPPEEITEGEEQEGEEAELTLNLSGSDDSDVERKLKSNGSANIKEGEKNKEQELKIEKETRSFVSELSESSSDSGLIKRELQQVTPKKEESRGSRLQSSSSTKSDDLEGEGTPLRRSGRQHVTSIRQVPTPRRSIKSMSTSPGSKQLGETVAASSRKVSIDSEKRDTSAVTKEIKKILSHAIASNNPAKQIEEKRELEKPQKSPISKTTSRKPQTSSREPSQEKTLSQSKLEDSPTITSKRTTRTTRAGSVAKDATAKQHEPVRKTRAASIAKESAIVEMSVADEDVIDEPKEKKGRGRPPKVSKNITSNVTPKKESIKAKSEDSDETPEEVVKVAKSRATRTTSQLPKDTSAVKATTRKTRAGSVAADEVTAAHEEKPTRKTRAGSVAVDEKDKPVRRTRAGSVAVDEEDKPARKTRAGSVAVDEEDKPVRKTRAGSVAVDEEDKPARKTRAGSVVVDEEAHEAERPVRKTRGASVAKEDETVTSRKTRASSMAKESSNTTQEDSKSVPKRGTRASSLAKDMSNAEVADDTLGKRSSRKRGNSVPKEVPAIIVEPPRLTSRGRRSTSLLKEVILEESISQLDSPASSKRNRLPRAIEQAAVSSPASNTRSRRSSIQSVPEEIEEVVNQPVQTSRTTSKNTSESKDESRTRRATSVDSSVIPPTGKRLTRSVLAKTSILEEIIPEESTSKSPQTKKQPTRRKRATSLSVEAIEEAEKEKAKVKPKRGRKASENKDKGFLFSPPEEAGEITESGEECRTPIFKFSEPTGLQKFLTPVRYDDDEESSDMTTNLLKRDFQIDSERKTSARIQRHPRTCFVLPKKNKK